MANGTITVAVDAETSKAKSKIQALQKEVQGSQSLKSLGGGLKGLGLDGMGGQLAGLGDALGALGKFAGPAAAVGGIAVIAKGLGDMAERGQEAAKAAQTMEVQLTQLSRNFGGTGAGVKEVTRELQLMSANGVNSMESITSAMDVLTVACRGNVVQAGELVKSFDNLSAGTGVQIDQWAEMTAKVMNTGVSLRDLTKLANRGVPIYQAFADTLGTTAEEAESLAKAGKITTEDWMKAVNQLAQSYKGLSSAMSSQTIEGAQGTYQAMRSMQMQATAEGRNSVLIDALNENSAKIQAQLDDPVRTEQLRATGELAGKMDWLGMQIKEAISDLPGMIAQGLVNLEATIQDMSHWLNLGNSSNDVGARRYMANVLGKDLAEQQEFISGDHTAADWAGKIKENEATIKRIETLIANGELEAETAKYLEANIENYKQINAILAENLRYAESNERTASEIKQREEEQQAQVQAILDRSAAMQKEFRQMDVREATASGDPRKLMEVYFGPLMADLETYFAGIPALRDKLQAGLGTEEDLEIYKMLLQAQEMYRKQLEEEAKQKEKQAQDIEKMKQDYKDGIMRDIANTQSELQSVNDKIQEQRMLDQEIADEEAHGIYRQKWGNLDISTVKSESAGLLKKQAELNDKLAKLDEKWKNSDQHIEDAIKSVNDFTDALGNRIISINAVVDPIRVG